MNEDSQRQLPTGRFVILHEVPDKPGMLGAIDGYGRAVMKIERDPRTKTTITIVFDGEFTMYHTPDKTTAAHEIEDPAKVIEWGEQADRG